MHDNPDNTPAPSPPLESDTNKGLLDTDSRPLHTVQDLIDSLPKPGVPAKSELERTWTDAEARTKEIGLEKLVIWNRREADYNRLRNHWSIFLMAVLGVLVAFQLTLAVLIGCNVLVYSPNNDNRLYLNLLVGETFVQIVALCIIVVKFLFPKEQEDELRDHNKTKFAKKDPPKSD